MITRNRWIRLLGIMTAGVIVLARPGWAADERATVRSGFEAQPTPRRAWEAFLEVNRQQVTSAALGIYDEAAQALMRANSARAQERLYQLYAGQTPTIRQQGDRAAVVFLRDPQHVLAPWFFHRTAAGWQLDGSMYPEVIGYTGSNQWFFKQRSHAYPFAFRDFTMDQHGFAWPRQ